MKVIKHEDLPEKGKFILGYPWSTATGIWSHPVPPKPQNL